MLLQDRNTNESEQVNWRTIDSLIGTWLVERQDLIRRYCALTQADLPEDEFEIRLEAFCEVMVDYLSAGHFEIFTTLEDEARFFDARGLQLVNALYPYLEQSTEVALWFNDRCEQLRNRVSENKTQEYQKIHSDLSYLGESLTDRFELEDQLIEYVHRSNRISIV